MGHTLRAIWTPDYNQPAAETHQDLPFRTLLTPRDRELLVNATVASPTLPTRANRLMLTALGGWLDTAGAWPNNELEAWEQCSPRESARREIALDTVSGVGEFLVARRGLGKIGCAMRTWL